MAQVGVLSVSLLMQHDHYDMNTGGSAMTMTRTASATVKISNPALQTNNAPVFTMLKRVLVLGPSPGTMRVDFTLERTGGAGTVHGQVRIIRNGVAIFTGTDFSTAGGPLVCSETPIAQALLPGDAIDIWGYKNGVGTVCNVSVMEVDYTGAITNLSRTLLVAPLVTSGTDFPYLIVS